MVVVRSTATFRCREGGIEARSTGRIAVNAIDGLDHVGAGLAKNGQNDGALAIGEAEVAGVLDGIDDLRNVPEPDGRACMSGDDQRLDTRRL